MRFGQAIAYARAGKKIARLGWNGKNMYVYMVRALPIPIDKWMAMTPSQELTEDEIKEGYVLVEGHLDMMNAQGRRVVGWLASQTDMLADDWYVVEDKCTPEDE